MSRSLLSLLLLLAMGLSLFAGPHPCHAQQVKPKAMGKSCHMPMKTAGPPTGPSVSAPGGHDCCKTSHGSLCENVCHVTAVAQTERLMFRIAPVAQAVAEMSCSGLSVLARAIDHVPLV